MVVEQHNNNGGLPSDCPIKNTPDSTVELKFIKSPWSTPCLVLNNFLYNSHSTRGDIGYWRCHNYSRKVKEERCRARCVIKNGRLSALTGAQHNHPPHTEKIERIVRRNLADELQEQDMVRNQQQQQALPCYQPAREIKSQPHVQNSEDFLLLMAPASTCCSTTNNLQSDAAADGQERQPMTRTIRQHDTTAMLDVVTGAPLISTVTTAVVPPTVSELIKMEEYDLPTVEM
uniref:FLYWCH-type domain-containing protein n=1 Tax=Anopheles maculatus TaxID=74869 RepID=A0A182SCM1_9DIPT